MVQLATNFVSTISYTIYRARRKYTLFECPYFIYFSLLRSEILHDLLLLKEKQCGVVKLLIETPFLSGTIRTCRFCTFLTGSKMDSGILLLICSWHFGCSKQTTTFAFHLLDEKVLCGKQKSNTQRQKNIHFRCLKFSYYSLRRSENLRDVPFLKVQHLQNDLFD